MRPHARRRTLPPRRFGPEDGQALTEAAIMLSLLAFAWMLMTYTGFLANNWLRTAPAARLVAWQGGNGAGTPSTGTLDSQFYGDEVSRGNLSRSRSRQDLPPTGGQLTGALAAVMKGDAYMVHRATVTWDATSRVTNPDPNHPFPYTFLAAEFPFMPTNNVVNQMLRQQTRCDWAELTDIWDDSDYFKQLEYLLSIVGM